MGGLVDKPVHKRQLLDDLNRDWTDNRGAIPLEC